MCIPNHRFLSAGHPPPAGARPGQRSCTRVNTRHALGESYSLGYQSGVGRRLLSGGQGCRCSCTMYSAVLCCTVYPCGSDADVAPARRACVDATVLSMSSSVDNAQRPSRWRAPCTGRPSRTARSRGAGANVRHAIIGQTAVPALASSVARLGGQDRTPSRWAARGRCAFSARHACGRTHAASSWSLPRREGKGKGKGKGRPSS